MVPEICFVRFQTSQGEFTIKARKKWSSVSYERFYNLIKEHFYDNSRLFGVIKGYVVQFGISGDPNINNVWKSRFLPSDNSVINNARGTIAFAMNQNQSNTRTTQIYINCADNTKLDSTFAPFAEVIEGMEIIDQLYHECGKDFDSQELQDKVEEEGNFFHTYFPLPNTIINAYFISAERASLKRHYRTIHHIFDSLEENENSFRKKSTSLGEWCSRLKSIDTNEYAEILYRLKKTVDFSAEHRIRKDNNLWNHQLNETLLMKSFCLLLINRFGEELKLVGNHKISFRVDRLHLNKIGNCCSNWHYDNSTSMALSMIIQNDFEQLGRHSLNIAYNCAIKDSNGKKCNHSQKLMPMVNSVESVEYPSDGAILINNMKGQIIHRMTPLTALNHEGALIVAQVQLKDSEWG